MSGFNYQGVCYPTISDAANVIGTMGFYDNVRSDWLSPRSFTFNASSVNVQYQDSTGVLVKQMWITPQVCVYDPVAAPMTQGSTLILVAAILAALMGFKIGKGYK